MRKLDIKKYIPDYKDFNLDKKYGISKKVYITGVKINPPYVIKAVCFDTFSSFENSPDGLKNAVLWLEAKRDDAIRHLGIFDD